MIAFTKIKKIQIGDYIFPDWTLYFGQSLQITAFLVFIGVAIYLITKHVFIEKKVIIIQLLNNYPICVHTIAMYEHIF